MTVKLSITLPHDMASMVRDKVQSGEYASSSEVVREALRLLQEREVVRAHKLAWIRDKAERLLNDPRPSVDAEEVFARLERETAAR